MPLDDQLIRHCGRCKGSWISEDVLHERVAAMHQDGGRVAWRRETRAALPCAMCNEPMETLVAHDAPVDRCSKHGVWFDANELGHVMLVASQSRPVAASSEAPGVAAELAAEVAIETAIAAPEATVAVVEVAAESGVFEVVIGGIGFVAESVVDVIAGIFD